MIHYIDFEPYNYFRRHLDMEYDYLTFPEYQYKWMVNKRGMGNRKRISEYIKYLKENNNIKFKFVVKTCFLDKEILDEVIEYPNFPPKILETYEKIISTQKHRFVSKYKNLPIEDFIVGNAYLIVEKI